MPELPEVEYTARQLRDTLVGATITSAQVFWERTISHPDLPAFLAEIAGREILAVRRRGKLLALDLDGDLLVTIHRRMSGNLLLLPAGWDIDTSLRDRDPAAWNTRGPTFYHANESTADGPPPAGHRPHAPPPAGPPPDAPCGHPYILDNPTTPAATPWVAGGGGASGDVGMPLVGIRPTDIDGPGTSDAGIWSGDPGIRPAIDNEKLLLYCRVSFNLADGRRLLYTDPRKFGRVALWPRAQEAEAFNGYGIEPLGEEFTAEELARLLAGHSGAIKPLLLNQALIAGIGNIYADEALYYASIHPLRPASSLSPDEIRLLHKAIVTVLAQGIEHGGTSFNEYRDLWGEAGENYDHVGVYQRTGKPCPRCGTPIERIVVAQRGTHFCPNCQRLTLE